MGMCAPLCLHDGTLCLCRVFTCVREVYAVSVCLIGYQCARTCAHCGVRTFRGARGKTCVHESVPVQVYVAVHENVRMRPCSFVVVCSSRSTPQFRVTMPEGMVRWPPCETTEQATVEAPVGEIFRLIRPACSGSCPGGQ